MTARALWTVEAMASAMAAECQGQLPQSIAGLSIDSRSIAPGEAFFAIHGDRRDGHDFVAGALAALFHYVPLVARLLSCNAASMRAWRNWQTRRI